MKEAAKDWFGCAMDCPGGGDVSYSSSIPPSASSSLDTSSSSCSPKVVAFLPKVLVAGLKELPNVARGGRPAGVVDLLVRYEGGLPAGVVDGAVRMERELGVVGIVKDIDAVAGVVVVV